MSDSPAHLNGELLREHAAVRVVRRTLMAVQRLAVTGSQRQALIILSGMVTWLVDDGYLRGNPMALLRQRAKRAAPRVTRSLSISLLDEVKAFVAQLPQDTVVQKAYYAPCRWLTTGQGTRLSEVPAGKIGD